MLSLLTVGGGVSGNLLVGVAGSGSLLFTGVTGVGPLIAGDPVTWSDKGV